MKTKQELNNQLRKELIKTMAKIYSYYSKEFSYSELYKSVDVHCKTDVGLNSIYKALMRISKDCQYADIQRLRGKLSLLKSVYDGK